MILARDRRQRFRLVHIASSLKSLELAVSGLHNKIRIYCPNWTSFGCKAMI